MDPKRLMERRIANARAAGERWRLREPERSGANRRVLESGPEAADTPERVAQFRTRESLRSAQAAALAQSFSVTKERQIGPTLDFLRFPPDEDARKAGRPVARIVTLAGANILPQGFGTGFLVSPRLLMTNHHVLPTKAEARGNGANFLHEFNSAGLQSGVVYELDPDGFYESDEACDFALVAVRPDPALPLLESYGVVSLIGATGKILLGHPIGIVQHPLGGAKQYATTQNKLLDVLEAGFLHYSTDTLPGSSGSPAFNSFWELVALHHSGVPMMQNGRIMAKDGRPWDGATMSDEEILWVANEGVRVSRIVQYLRGIKPLDAAWAAEMANLLERTKDPLGSPQLQSANGGARTAPMELAMDHITINVSGGATMYFGRVDAKPEAAPISVVTVAPAIAAPEKQIRFDKNYKNRAGYDRDFLGVRIEAPKVDDGKLPDLLMQGNRPLVLKYHHFSLVMDRERRLQVWSAVNVDYSPERKSTKDRKAFGSDTWIADPRIPGELQIQNEDFYGPATKIDRGHVVRRDDNAWGDSELEIEYANSDTFHWTNCTPQHEAFNREMLDGLWGSLESRITDQIGAVGNRASIFAGPILDPDDPKADFNHGPVQYPLKFWKVIVCESADSGQRELCTYGFLLSQEGAVRRFGIEAMDFGRLKRYQVSVASIEQMAGVRFDQRLAEADVLRGDGGQELIELNGLEAVRLKDRRRQEREPVGAHNGERALAR